MRQVLLETEAAIRLVKETFTQELTQALHLTPVSAPLIVQDGTGINDDLNGVERPVSFRVKALKQRKAVVVHSLAKWKRIRLQQLGVLSGQGILTEMRALRPDEDCSPLHSVYVDQWDWEQHIHLQDRNLTYLKHVVSHIFEAMKRTEQLVASYDPAIPCVLPDSIHFVHAAALQRQYPTLTPAERETASAHEHGAVFIMGIGDCLPDGQPHDGRAPDYDDWSTPNEEGYAGLNGDIIVWHPVLKRAVELSSMGIRVDPPALLRQLAERNCMQRAKLSFHKQLLAGELPASIGGGIGQSRLCLFMLKKRHIGEVQVSIWPEDEINRLLAEGICLL